VLRFMGVIGEVSMNGGWETYDFELDGPMGGE
jgi:hypothetical protein